jgi:hypothetical protein
VDHLLWSRGNATCTVYNALWIAVPSASRAPRPTSKPYAAVRLRLGVQHVPGCCSGAGGAVHGVTAAVVPVVAVACAVCSVKP